MKETQFWFILKNLGGKDELDGQKLRESLPTFKNTCCLVTKSCPTLCDPIDCSPPKALLSMGLSRQEY